MFIEIKNEVDPMKSRILVTFASRTGSTAEIAEAIGKTLSQHNANVDVLPMQDVKDLCPYSAVIVGSAIRQAKWLPEAMKFIQDHRTELAQKPVATFTVCITLAMSNSDQYHQAVRGWIAPVHTHVKPISEGLFAGRLDFAKLPLDFDTLKFRLVVALGIFPKDDRRDWKAIHDWAESLCPQFLQ
jgi:menaquinone-dependent protoporphyrinogen oxidase